jgi:hypothetical protein
MMAEDERRRPIEFERPPYEEKFRRYLLGLSPPDESTDVERGIFEGEHPILEVIEDELIEDYVTGELNEADRSHFEQRFLTSQERVEKIRLSAMLLRRPEVVESLSQRVENLGPKFVIDADLVSDAGQWFGGPAVEPMTGPTATEPSLGSSHASAQPAPAPHTQRTAVGKWFAVGAVVMLGAWLYTYSFQHFYQMPPPPPRPPTISANLVPYVASAKISEASLQAAYDYPHPGYRTYVLTVNGSGFARGSVVRCNGLVDLTLFVRAWDVSPSELRAYTDLSESEYKKLLSAEVVVVNPPPGGGASLPVKILVQSAPRNPSNPVDTRKPR